MPSLFWRSVKVILVRACRVGDRVALSVTRLFDTQVVSCLVFGNSFILASFESIWHVSSFFDQLPYFLTQDVLGSSFLTLESDIFPRGPGSFNEKWYLDGKIWALGVLTATGVCQCLKTRSVGRAVPCSYTHTHTQLFFIYVHIKSGKVTLNLLFWSSSIGFILIVSFSDVIKTAVLRCNLQTIQFAYLKCMIQWLLVYTQNCAAIATGSCRALSFFP